MLLTEQEAKKKKCPYRHATGREANGTHCPTYSIWTSFYDCYASGCMAWRQETRTWIISEARFAVEDDSVSQGDDEIRNTELGYCGLAGRPE